MNTTRKKVDFSKFDNSTYYKHKASGLKRILWYYTNVLFFVNPLFPFRSVKPAILRLFGAKIGKHVVIHPGVNIKLPWNLDIGDYVWIGQRAWLDSVEMLTIENNVNISQGVYIICGGHDYKRVDHKTTYAPIHLEEGCWIGAFSMVTEGVRVGTHAVLAANSVASRDMEPYMIYRGNPAVPVRERVIE